MCGAAIFYVLKGQSLDTKPFFDELAGWLRKCFFEHLPSIIYIRHHQRQHSNQLTEKKERKEPQQQTQSTPKKEQK
jgi:hypothetical protein